MVFVDTSAWFASSVRTDRDYARAVQWLADNRKNLVTTDHVVDELLTLLRHRGELRRALHMGSDLFGGVLARVEKVTAEDIDRAWSVFRDFHDKAWSFTDCVSRVVMERLKVKTAFAFDEHFRQFGTVTVVP
jgi:hypothetical protein